VPGIEAASLAQDPETLHKSTSLTISRVCRRRAGRASIDSFANARRKRSHERSTLMRGLLTAYVALQFPGHRAGRGRARMLGKTTAKTTTKTV